MVVDFTDFTTSTYSKLPHYFVVGHPIKHSLSPLMHNLSLKSNRIDAAYFAINLKPEDIPGFTAWCNRDEFLGCNITIPYKQQLLDIVDGLDPVAKDVGAINTIAKTTKKLKGYNTDLYGFIEPLKAYENELAGTDAIIFGTGGASKAISKALRNTGMERLFFVSRSPGRHDFPAQNRQEQTIGYNEWPAYIDNVSLIVNTTPLGMQPYAGQSPVREGEKHLLKGKICYDIVYNPIQTTFLKQASDNAIAAINGLDMLIYQGSKSFEIWTGHTFPVQHVRERLLKEFNSNG